MLTKGVNLVNAVARISSGQPISDPTSLDKMLFHEGRASFRTKELLHKACELRYWSQYEATVPCIKVGRIGICTIPSLKS